MCLEGIGPLYLNFLSIIYILYFWRYNNILATPNLNWPPSPHLGILLDLDQKSKYTRLTTFVDAGVKIITSEIMYWMNVLEEGVNYVCPSNKISPFRVGNQINRLSKIELNFVWSDSESKLQQNNQISSITCFILDLPKLWNKLFL